MKQILTICTFFILSGVFAQTKFGALLDPGFVANANEHKITVAKKLGIKIIRDQIILTDPKDKGLLNTDFDVFLNINYGRVNSGGERAPVPFPTDLENYKRLLTNVVSSYRGKKPVVVAIENEENNFQYHSGTAQDYLNELKTAIPILHAAGIKVTNAGIT